jgi:hypothetical protein
MTNVFKLIEDNGLTLHGDIEHFAELVRAAEHVTDGSPCWCGAEVTYVDPETGVTIISHKEPQ